MANIAPARAIVQPSYVLPETMMHYQQQSGAFCLLPDEAPAVRIATEDQFVYVKKLDVRTSVAAGQGSQTYNSLPSATVVPSMASIPVYNIRSRAEYDHHDIASMSGWDVPLPEAQRFANRMGMAQQLRNMLLYGYNATNGEGLLNTNGATAINLPADSDGNDTVLTYDNGQMATFFLGVISATKNRTMTLGIPARFVICGPQRILSAFEYQNIVQVTSFQREGAGSTSTAGVIKAVAAWNDDQIEWVYDDTLIGKGAGGTDAVIVAMPELKVKPGVRFDTNEFAKLKPGLLSCNLQFLDMPAPREIPTPLPGGAIDVLFEMRGTPGWGVRPENLTIISMTY